MPRAVEEPIPGPLQRTGVTRPSSPQREPPTGSADESSAQALHDELETMTRRALKKRAREFGVDQEKIDEADAETSSLVESTFSSGLGLRRDPTADLVATGAASKLLPYDLRESYAEVRRKPGNALIWVCRWLMVVTTYVLVGAGIYQAMFQLYFDDMQLQRCEGWAVDASRHWIETFIGAVPAQARTVLLTAAFMSLCRKMTQARDQGVSLTTALLVVGSDGNAETIRCAGWEAIVDLSGASNTGQSTWDEAREARKLTQRQAVSSAVLKLTCWHWSQPIVFLWMLVPYRCYIASLGAWQPRFAAVVAAREVLYLGSTLLAAWKCPVFLLMDPVTAWKEAKGRVERVRRAAMYVLTPHNYTALCLARRFPGWRRAFLGLAGIQVLADLSSCLGLAALMEGAIEMETQDQSSNRTPTAIIIGYVLTTSGFLLFFGPLSVATTLGIAGDTHRHSCVRAGMALAGGVLLCALAYIVLLYVLLIGGWFNPYCNGFTLNSDPCNSHGECFGVGRCHCEVGFGPNVTYNGEPLCACHPACVHGTCAADGDGHKCLCDGEWTGSACTDEPCVAHNKSSVSHHSSASLTAL
eukprot:COSAG02_NODE_1598_length_11761_cov_15.902418_5_plen_584_part_00